jgi:DNA-directed RNA polymerase beta' subunit
MGHIKLSVPVTHIWFLRGVPSRLGLILDLGVQELEKVAYFASYIITNVNEEARIETMEQIEKEFKGKKKLMEDKYEMLIANRGQVYRLSIWVISDECVIVPSYKFMRYDRTKRSETDYKICSK